MYKFPIDGRGCFSVRKPCLTAEKSGDNHVFELRDNFCFVHCCCQRRECNVAKEDFDKPIYGVERIGRIANIPKEDGSVDTRAAYYALEKGFIDADKFGRKWRTTPRRVLSRNLAS